MLTDMQKKGLDLLTELICCEADAIIQIDNEDFLNKSIDCYLNVAAEHRNIIQEKKKELKAYIGIFKGIPKETLLNIIDKSIEINGIEFKNGYCLNKLYISIENDLNELGEIND